VEVSEIANDSNASAHDILLYPCGGRCDSKSTFPGKILTFNGESSAGKCLVHNSQAVNFFTVSPIDATRPTVFNDWAYAMTMYLGSLDWKSQTSIYRPENRAVNTKELFLIYAASNCVSFRERAFTKLSTIGPVEYAGRCKGMHSKRMPGNFTRRPGTGIFPAPKDGNTNWAGNVELFHKYRFALVMENRNKNGYITEKILNAFMAGSIPIYYGTAEVFNVFNRKSFIYYDINDAGRGRRVRDQIAYLERNKTAYDEMLKEPILANGTQTVEQYFSWSDQVGGGQLKWKIRELMGFGADSSSALI